MERKISFQQAINEALSQEMARDPTRHRDGRGRCGRQRLGWRMDAWGGVLGVTKGLWDKFGDRVHGHPLSASRPSSALRWARRSRACGR